MRLSDDGECVEIFFGDLTTEAQQDLISLMGLEGPEDANWDGDLMPIADVPIGEDLWDGDEYVGDDDEDEDEELEDPEEDHVA